MERGLLKNQLVFYVVVAAAILTDSLTNGQVNVEPNTALLNEGDRTELLCRYGRAINYCRIEIPGEKVLNLSPDWSKTPGFTYYGAGLAAGQCGVSIDRVKATNNGQVKCSLGVEGEEISGTIDLVVALRPQQPQIELISKSDNQGYFTEGDLFHARCVVRDGRPAANITWLIDDMPANKRVSQMEFVASQPNGNIELSTTVQEIQWHLSQEDDGRKLICRSHHQTDRESVPPQEGAFLLLVRFPPVRQEKILVYGLYLERTALVNVTIRANPAPIVEWIIDGNVIPQGTQFDRFSVYEPVPLGQDYYNVSMAIAGLTLEDTTKLYQMRASNALGATDYQVTISSSSTPPTAGLEIGAIVGIVVALAVLIVIILLVVFARATGRWCFGGKSVKTATNETSDTESADIKASSTTATEALPTASDSVNAAPTAEGTEPASNDAQDGSAASPPAIVTQPSKSKRLPSFAAIFKRKSDKAAKKLHDVEQGEGVADPSTVAADANTDGTDGNDNQPKEDKQLVYAELVLKPADNSDPPPPPKNATEYAEIVYVQKPGKKK